MTMIRTASPNSAIPGEVFRASHTPNRWGMTPNAHWAAYDRDGRRIATGQPMPGYTSCEPTADELAIWDAEAVRAAANAQAWPVDPTDPALYIRFGRLPRAGRSRNYLTGEYEAGVSVYNARYNAATDVLDASSALGGTYIHYLIEGRDAYLLTGAECGVGSDGEPVLADVRIIATLASTPEGFRIA